MKIGVCTLNSGHEYKESVKLCIDSLNKYCFINNYTLINDESILGNREPMWNKMLLLEKYLKILDCNSFVYDYLVWIDSDIMIMNTNIKLENLIFDYMCNKDFMLATDSGLQINTGVWFIKNTEYSRNIISLIYNLPELAGNYHEQGVFIQLYNKNLFNLKEHSIIIPENHHNLFNCSLYTYNYGDFLIHFLGIHKKEWMEIVTNDYYPYQKLNEDINNYNNRLDFIKSKSNNRYSIPKPYIKICVCTIINGDKYTDDVVYLSNKSLKMYCEKHDYELVIEKDLLDNNLPPHWSKLLLMKKLLSNNSYDYIVWLDADILICNHDIKLEDIMKKYMDNKSFLLTRDISEHINTGVWFVKNCQYSINLLELNFKLSELRYRGYEDQDVLNRIYDRNLLNFKDNSVILPPNSQHIFNCCVGLYKYGTFLIHFFSLSKQGLKEAFNDFYPFKLDYEDEYTYNNRLEWIKSFNKSLNY
jgi:hypothetical protein